MFLFQVVLLYDCCLTSWFNDWYCLRQCLSTKSMVHQTRVAQKAAMIKHLNSCRTEEFDLIFFLLYHIKFNRPLVSEPKQTSELLLYWSYVYIFFSIPSKLFQSYRRHNSCAYTLWAGRGLYRATREVTRRPWGFMGVWW